MSRQNEIFHGYEPIAALTDRMPVWTRTRQCGVPALEAQYSACWDD